VTSKKRIEREVSTKRLTRGNNKALKTYDAGLYITMTILSRQIESWLQR